MKLYSLPSTLPHCSYPRHPSYPLSRHTNREHWPFNHTNDRAFTILTRIHINFSKQAYTSGFDERMFTIGVFTSCLGFCVAFGRLVPFYPDLAHHVMIVPSVSMSFFCVALALGLCTSVFHSRFPCCHVILASRCIVGYRILDLLVFVHTLWGCLFPACYYPYPHPYPGVFWAWDRIESNLMKYLHARCCLGVLFVRTC